MELTEAKTILVTFLMQLGDLILTTPFLSALRRAAPNAKIVYLIDEKWLDVVSANPDVDEVLTIDRKGRDKSIVALWRYSKKLRVWNFDYLINLNPSERCSFLAAFSGAKYKTGAAHRLFRPFFDKPLSLNRNLHAADMYLDILSKLGVAAVGEGLKIIPPAKGEEEAADFFAAHGITATDKLAGFNIGSASATKRWLPERFAKVADCMAAKGYKTVFFGSAGEKAMVEETIGQMRATPLVATGKFSMGGLCAALGRLNILITNDSGPMHIAVSRKVPLVAIYGPSKPELYGPYKAKNALVVRAEPRCQGCTDRMKHECPDMHCMNDLSAEQVLDAVEKLIR